ncbi:S-adenosyl-L-methionine-dependent methyltransferase [Gracilaria domingensis]|nr:S-adenosyl-L-methionine-dependent methyltransferase [Gracilaria domingensis]
MRTRLSALVTFATLIQYQIIRFELPALYSSPIADALSIGLPPVTIAVGALLLKWVPPICFLPVVIYPALSASIMPGYQLACLLLLTSLVVCASRADLFAASTASVIFFAIDMLVQNLFPSMWSNKMLRSYLPSITFSLASVHFALRSKTLATVRFWPGKRQRRNNKISLTYRLLLVSAVSSLTGQLPPLIQPPGIPADFSLLDQARGPTGLISVVEKQGMFRALLADISVLGGYFDSSKFYPDSIFSQFYVHEAVRFTDDNQGDRAALCIGVGIGVVANGLSAHGVNVTAVDIDPVVARFAEKYFALEVPVVVEDAVSYVAKTRDKSYNYVIHDVFTGGTMPSALFSNETFEDISRVLKSDGVLVVNFVGAVESPKTPATEAVSIVFQRLKHIFGNVRAFSDGMDSSMHNIVFFASNEPQKMKFRKPREEDFLGSPLRKRALSDFLEHEIDEEILEGSADSSGVDWLMFRGLFDIAEEHRKLMYTLHPKDLWPAVLALERAR